jgi:hypothetical protein
MSTRFYTDIEISQYGVARRCYTLLQLDLKLFEREQCLSLDGQNQPIRLLQIVCDHHCFDRKNQTQIKMQS